MTRDLTQRIDHSLSRSKVIQTYAELLRSPLDALFGKGLLHPLKLLLNGTILEHPLHPVLTDIPIGAWTLAVLLDLLALIVGLPNLGTAAAISVGLGVLGALASIVTCLMDWMDLEGTDQAVGVVHGTINIIGTVLFIASFFLRANNLWLAGGWATALAIIGYLVIMVGGFLGGSLVFRRGVMVDRNAYLRQQNDFFDALEVAALPERQLTRVEVDGQPVLLYRDGDRTSAIGAVCSHLGGPLHKGKVKNNCVECPWHYTQFSLLDGHVHRGPATAPVPAYETRVSNGKLQVRRKE